MRSFLLALVCLLPVLALPAAADPASSAPPRPSNLRSDILYTHRGEFVQVGPMRPLTLNAHVEQFAYDPQGLEIAYVGSKPQGDDTLRFVKTVDVRTGKEISRLTLTSPMDGKNTSFHLLGFSPSGKYLLLQETLADEDDPNSSHTEYVRWDLSASPSAVLNISPEALLPDGVLPDAGTGYGFASPDRRWIVFKQFFHQPTEAHSQGPQQSAYALYDTEKNTFGLLTLPPNVFAFSWADDSRLKIVQPHETNRDAKRFNVVTGEVTPLPDDTKLDPPPASQQYPNLMLDTEQRDLDDLKDGTGHTPTCIVWIRRTPFGRVPLGSAAAGIMPSRPQVNAPWENDPQAAWSPTGKQVAFLANDDLYVTNLVAATDLLPHEKMAVGLKLSCEEEQQLAMSNLKQIGLALIQYTQDFDEHFPPTKDIEQTLYPYLKTTDVFSVGSARWAYRGVSNASLSSIDDPAETVEATTDLPCARIVLFADGHVKAYPKQETMP